ncbi:hypothetical protein [Clostridium pasteurianum]|uniref:Tetratricopeptide repeat protein n=1 Tax=Clostridium pasteurianum BC1 TaxID=86416 RepID=R4K957_CLOPA|nr:hypothetical protein [Clostridium pasteurianum]AGK96180.1 hypothetical protein Clopa_1187 [Clostridium pasteurianum BC1]
MRKENIRKRKRIRLIIVTCIVFFIIMTSSVYAYSLNSYNNLMNNGTQFLKEDKFDSSIVSYKKAQSTFLGKKHSKEINDNINLANKVKNSKQSYDQGMQLYKDKKYIEAMDSFKKVAKEDSKRYIDSNNKINELKKLHIAENIENAKNEANNKKYDSAINFLNVVLNFDSNNNEANQLKNEYDSLIKKQKEDEENKARQLQEAEQLKKETAEKNTNSTTNSNSNTQKNANITANSNNNTQKNINSTTNSNSKTQQSSNSTTNYTETVGVSNGWFSIKKNDGIIAPNGFGMRRIWYVDTFSEIYFDFAQGSAGEALNYDITFHLQGRDVNYKDTASNNLKSIPVSLSDLPKGYNVRIDVSVVYKGKTYNDTFYKVLNNG